MKYYLIVSSCVFIYLLFLIKEVIMVILIKNNTNEFLLMTNKIRESTIGATIMVHNIFKAFFIQIWL